jgi:hypothetical protein
MGKPPFVMSKYARREDLLSDAAEYYEAECDRLQRIIDNRPAINAGLVEAYNGVLYCPYCGGKLINETGLKNENL